MRGERHRVNLGTYLQTRLQPNRAYAFDIETENKEAEVIRHAEVDQETVQADVATSHKGNRNEED